MPNVLLFNKSPTLTCIGILDSSNMKRNIFSFQVFGKYILSIEMWLILLTILLGIIPQYILMDFGDYAPGNVEGSFGVNAYGWINGDFGGGTTARCVILGLISCEILFSAIPISGAELHSHKNTMASNMRIVDTPQDYIFDLLLINAANTIPVLSNKANRISNTHYRIGLWHWETSYLPSDQADAGRYYDEIWTPSTYVANSILHSPTFPISVMVKVIPYGYESLPALVTSELRLKSRLLLPSLLPVDGDTGVACARCSPHALETLTKWSTMNETLTLFLIVFDFNSDYNRKNILGSIDAFLKAFPAVGSTASTGLILKSSHALHQWADYEHVMWILETTDTEQRIVLLDGVLPADQLATLKAVPDCYISLHRSEGWGLNILESLLMGVPVVATAYGGSEQFLRPLYERRAPLLRIPYDLVNVSPL